LLRKIKKQQSSAGKKDKALRLFKMRAPQSSFASFCFFSLRRSAFFAT